MQQYETAPNFFRKESVEMCDMPVNQLAKSASKLVQNVDFLFEIFRVTFFIASIGAQDVARFQNTAIL
jgi:hypothetical protein